MPSFIGTGADQVPVNSMLGSLAYQNADDVKLGKVTYSGDLSGNGNIGVGVTPRQWSTSWKAVEVGSGGALSGDSGVGVHVSSNGYWTGSNWIYNATGYACDYYQSAGTHVWRYSPSGSAGTTITWTQAMTLDASGNLGLGVIPNAWLTGGGFIQVPGNGFIGNNTSMSSNSMLLGSNAYFDTTWKYRTSSLAATFFQAGNGTFSWYTAPTGTAGATVTFTQAMSLDSSNLILSGTGATKVQEGTTAQRPASPQEGMIRKNSSTVKIEAYLNSSWVNLDAGELLSITEYTGSPGVDQSFTLNPRTKSIFVEMVAGGGAGGTVSTATYTAGHASAASYGAVGTYCIFRIPPNLLQSTYYYRIGDGGVAGGFSSGGDTILSETLAGLTNGVGRILVSGGEAGKNGDTPAPPPVAPLNQASTNRQLARSGNFLNVNLIAHNSGASPRGFNILILGASTHLTVLSPEHHSYALNEYRPAHPTFMQYGGGGKGAHKYQGGYTDGAHDGFQGMIRVYEYA